MSFPRERPWHAGHTSFSPPKNTKAIIIEDNEYIVTTPAAMTILSAMVAAMSRVFVEHCEAVAAEIDIKRRWLGEQ
jgi:hypothetical protein